MANVTNLEVWQELIPPENFEIQGFGVFRATDVTSSHMISALREDLFEDETVFQREGFASLKEKLQIYLEEPDIDLGLAAIRNEQIFLLPLAKTRPEKTCALENTAADQKDEFRGSIFTRAMDLGEPLVLEDLDHCPECTPLEEGLRQGGYKSVYVAPLRYQERLLGVLVVKSTRVGALNALNAAHLAQVLPLFTVALNRSLEQLDQRIQTVIKEECTAIHPSVEWRFQQAAWNYIQRKGEGVSGLEPILFEMSTPCSASPTSGPPAITGTTPSKPTSSTTSRPSKRFSSWPMSTGPCPSWPPSATASTSTSWALMPASTPGMKPPSPILSSR